MGSQGQSLMMTAFVIFAWYMSNTFVILANKALLSRFDFRGPVFITLCQMMTCSALSYAAAASRLTKVQQLSSDLQLGKIVFLAVIFLLSIVLGNISLRFIPVSFNQAISATTPVFTALLAFLLFQERETTRTYLTLVPIVVGIVIASGAEPLFDMLGFATCLASTAARAMKSVVQGHLLSNPEEALDSMNLLRYMATAAAFFLVPMTIFFEPESVKQAQELGQNSTFWMLMLVSCVLAYSANLTNFLVTKYTSALTLQVLGNAKGVVTVAISLLLFRNPVTFSSMLGYAMTVGGVVVYSQSKTADKKQAELEKLAQPAVGEPEARV